MNEINITVNGMLYTGRFTLDSNVVTVQSAYGKKSTQLGRLAPVTVAEMLLRELVRASMS
ncbi:hypothetical protein AWB82_04207 [Caballeronia glebae]|uniref:Uncharacterized protein n=1 Tax=Caballeronia glebae TaxID=1777143 RepID=A0A158BJR4_9BURK|nr:hypothetical protein [Caballeronia glebae]SAK70291.1 hypothetical protein AWB82_04207 [Caballeronia glebae]